MKEYLTEEQSLELYMKHTAFGNREMEELRFHSAVNEAISHKSTMLEMAVDLLELLPSCLGMEQLEADIERFLEKYYEDQNSKY